MPPQLLPASAAAFAPRASSVNVVLGSKVEPWLTQTLKRINRIKRPLNSVPQHQRCLTETLSSPDAIWTLCSLMLTKVPDADLSQDSKPWQIIHVEAYIVHVDMVLRNEVAFKLTQDTIDTLTEFHKDVFCVNAKANTREWPEKEQQSKKLHEDFIQAVNKFVFRAHVSALEGLEEDGSGELLKGTAEEVKNNVLGLMKQLLPPPPPPPRIIDVVRPAPTLLPNSPAHPNLWSQATTPSPLPAPVDPWRVLPSSPGVNISITSSSAESCSTHSSSPIIWADMTLGEMQMASPSHSPAYSQPMSTAGLYFNTPLVTAPMPPLPSMLASQCGISAGYGSFGWDRYPAQQEYAATM